VSSRQAGFWADWQQASSDSSAPTTGTSTTASKANIHGTTTTSSSSSSKTAAQAGSATLKLNQPLQPLQQQQQQPGQSGIRSVGPGVSSAQTWSGWVQAKGWRGEAEVHRQQLLEWFGASPDKPLKGSAGEGTTIPWRPTRVLFE
jgi:hypothetical protein